MISIMTFMVLVLAFVYYYFIYVKSNEDAFNSKSFRIIEQQSKKVESIFANYEDIVRNAWNNRSDSFENENITEQTFASYVRLRDIVKGQYHIPESIIVIGAEQSKFFPSLLLIDSVKVSSSKAEFTVHFYTEVQGLTEGTLGNDFFEEYIMFSFDQVFWSSFKTTNALTIHNDTLFKRDKGELNNLFHSTDRLEIEFNNETQLLYFTPVNISSKPVFIGGVIKKTRFTQLVFKMGTDTVIVLLIIPLLLIFSMPFLKLLLLSENERLGTWDAILSFVVMALGFGFLLLYFLAFYSQAGPSANEKNRFLKTYARQIEKNIYTELNDVLTQIDTNQVTLTKDKKLLSSHPNQEKKQWVYDKTSNSTTYGKSIYPYSLGMSWMNSEAEQLVKWQPKHITPRVKVPFRKYFSMPNSNQNRLWSSKNINNGNGFYIEAIRAVTTGESYAVVSKRSDIIYLPLVDFENKKGVVVTMGSKFQSLTELPLPDNISYLVIDEGGNVLFHKNSAKNLQENIFDETNYDSKLSEAVYGRVDTIFKSNYNEIHSRFYISPLESMPLFLLLVMDEDQEKMNDAQVLSLTVVLFILLFFLLFFQIALFVFVDYRRKKKAKGYSLFFKWVWPMPSKKWAFQLLSLYLFISFIVFLAGSFYENALVTYSFFSFLVSINLFVLRRFKKPVSMSVKKYYLKYYIYFALMFLLGFLLFPFSDQLTQNQWLCSLAFLFISVAAIVGSFFMADADEEAPVQFTYNMWVFLFVFLLGLLSVLSFYTRVYNLEKTIAIQHHQLNLSNHLIENNVLVDTNKYHNYKSINTIYFQTLTDSLAHTISPREHNLIRYIRIQLNKNIALSAILQYPDTSSKEQMKWIETGNKIQLTVQSGNSVGNQPENLVLTSNKKSLHPLDFLLLRRPLFDGYRFEMFIGFLLFVIVLYLVVAYWSSKLFLLGIIPKLKSNISDLLHQSDFIYVVSPPHAGVRPFIEKELGLPIYFEDIRYTSDNKKEELKPAGSDKVALLFDAGSIDKETLIKSVQRIDALKQLVLKKKLLKLIVVSQFTPKKVLNTVTEREQLLRETDQANTLLELKKLSDQYLDIIGGFSLAYYKIGSENLRDQDKVTEFLDFELKGVNILDEQMISKIFKRSEYDQEDMVLNIQNKAQLYYYAIWNSLEKRERLLIYDLAQDGLVNYRNLYVIYNLMSRGILVFKNGRLMLFNRSFANFILSIVDIQQALEFERDAKRTGNWANLKLPFLLVIAAAVMFMFLTQQEVFSELFGWFTAAIAMLPILTRFILTFSGFSGKK